jgi:acyl-CoA dehydrogenase
MPPIVKYALTYLFVQAEFGLCCPLSMTDSLTRTLRKFGDPALVEQIPAAADHAGLRRPAAQGAMFMTEQAPAPTSATTTRAVPDAAGRWQLALYGDKWFCSNPDAGLAMVLARIDGARPA